LTNQGQKEQNFISSFKIILILPRIINLKILHPPPFGEAKVEATTPPEGGVATASNLRGGVISILISILTIVPSGVMIVFYPTKVFFILIYLQHLNWK
jgi:hypothetical protein